MQSLMQPRQAGKAHVGLRCDLDGEVAERFLALGRTFGLESYAELVRFCLSYTYAGMMAGAFKPPPEPAREIGKVDSVDLAEPPPVLPHEVQELARNLDIDPVDLTLQLPRIVATGGRTFGERRLEIFRNSGETYARVWIGQRCTYAVPLKCVPARESVIQK